MTNEPESTVRDRFFTAWARLVTRRPRTVLLLCALLTALSAWLTLTRLEFRSDRSELVDMSEPFQRRYLDFRARFPRWDDAVVVVDTATADSPEAAEAFIAELESTLKTDPRFRAVTAGFPRDEAPVAMLLTEPMDALQSRVAQMKRATVALTAPTLDSLFGLSWFAAGSLDAEQRSGLLGLLRRSVRAARGEDVSVLGLGGVQRLVSPGSTLATILVSMADQKEGTAALRAHIAELRARPRFAGIDAGVTGIPVLEGDETAQSTRDGRLAGGLALALIVALMLVNYRGVLVPLMAATALLVGVAWSFGWATLAVGHLQLLSVTFASLLMGMGIDVAIHVIARLELARSNHERLEHAVEEAFRGVGPGIVTSSLTVAAAAGAMALTPFSGVGEMGVIAAGGILLCTAAIMCSLPAMLAVIPGVERRIREAADGAGRPFLGRYGAALHSRPLPVVLVAGALLVVGAWSARGVGYDTDLKNLMPSGSESVRWQDRLERRDSRSVWHAVVLARDETEARDLTLRFRALPEVSDVGGAGILFHPEADTRAKQSLLQSLPGEEFVKSAMTHAEPNPTLLRAAAARLTQAWRGKDDPIADAAADLESMADEQLLLPHRRFQSDRDVLATIMLDMREAAPIGFDQLPAALRDLCTGTDGSLLLRIYPRATAAGVLAPESLGPFVRAVLGVAPSATGPCVQVYESTRLITRAYRDAALSALGAIALILLLDFRRLSDAACAMLPVVLGAAWMLGVMRAAGMSLNLANLIVMPLIVGIGVSCGVHAVRRWRMQPDDPPPGLAGGSGRAITLTTLTTIIGFGALCVGEHRGIRSLGATMSLGLTLVWLATVLVLPAVLRLRGQRS